MALPPGGGDFHLRYGAAMKARCFIGARSKHADLVQDAIARRFAKD
jgi:hypothetical protein